MSVPFKVIRHEFADLHVRLCVRWLVEGCRADIRPMACENCFGYSNIIFASAVVDTAVVRVLSVPSTW